MFANWHKFNSSLSLSVMTILVCRYNDVTLIDIELHGKGSTDCENPDNNSCVIISSSGLENFVYINRILTKLWLKARGSLNYGTPCIMSTLPCET